MDLSFKSILESASYDFQKKIILREINEARVIIDYSVFKKSKEEKEKLKFMKSDNKSERRSFYKEEYKNYLNVPSKSMETIKITN